MKLFLGLVMIAMALFFGYRLLTYNEVNNNEENNIENMVKEETQQKTLPEIKIISHATFILEWADLVVYSDPIGGAQAFEGQRPADVILVTDIHGDHLDPETIASLMTENTTLITPQAVADELPEDLTAKARVMANGEVITEEVYSFTLEAVPMYNLPEQELERVYHEKGRGNGYLLERDGVRIYMAGDTADTPEMRAMNSIDMAFVPMNLPYTMSVEDAASGVAAFKPKQVYPYHYRTPEGLSDVNKFKELVSEKAPDVEVVLLDWYPE